jgi:hypothetical protein
MVAQSDAPDGGRVDGMLRECTLIGYLLDCLRIGGLARLSVQAPGLSLSHRLPTLVVWLSFGLRGSGVVPGRGEAQEGFAQLEVAVPSQLDTCWFEYRRTD